MELKGNGRGAYGYCGFYYFSDFSITSSSENDQEDHFLLEIFVQLDWVILCSKNAIARD